MPTNEFSQSPLKSEDLTVGEDSAKIRIGVVGGAGYTGGEFLRLLLQHPSFELGFVQSRSQAGKTLGQVHSGLFFSDHQFVADYGGDVDAVVSCLGHGEARQWLQDAPVQPTRFLDLTADFRYEDSGKFVYGLPELYRADIANSSRVANPGCFATAIQLALLPAALCGALDQVDTHVTALTGSTGAGQSPTPTTHFSWRANNVSVYKAFEHQHLREIEQTLGIAKSVFRERELAEMDQPDPLELNVPEPEDDTGLTGAKGEQGVYGINTARRARAELLRMKRVGLRKGLAQAELQNRTGSIHFVPMRAPFARGILASCYFMGDYHPDDVIQFYHDYYEDEPFVRITNDPIDVKQVVQTNYCLLGLYPHRNKLHARKIINYAHK